MTTPVQSPTHDLRRVIGFAGGTALIVGITIGGGIFRKPPTIAGLVPDPLVIMGLWTAFGLVSICGALAVAELSSLLPRPGGVYVFLREAYGDAAAFVFGWLYVLVTTPTAVAALATVFAEFLLNLLGMPVAARAVQMIAIAAILTLTGANVLGARVGAAVSEVTTLAKVTALAAIILGAFLLGHGSLSHMTEHGVVEGGGLARAVASVFWTYDGWIAVSMIAGASPPPCTALPSVRFDRLPFPNRNAPMMIAASAVTFTRVVTSLTAAPTLAPSTLAPVRVMMARIAIICTVEVPGDLPSRLSRNSANTVASEATAVGVVINMYNQPKTNAAASP